MKNGASGFRFKDLSRIYDFLPDPFTFILVLTLFVFFCGISLTSFTSVEMVRFWGDGFWSITKLTIQMVMVVISGYSIAQSPPVQPLLHKIAVLGSSPNRCIVIATFTCAIASLIHWSIGLVVGGLICRALYDRIPKSSYPLLVAAAYSGFVFWHSGLSGTIPLILSNPEQAPNGVVIPFSETVFSLQNIGLILCLFFFVVACNILMLGPSSRSKVEISDRSLIKARAGFDRRKEKSKVTLSQRLASSPLLTYLACLIGVAYVLILSSDQRFHLSMDTLNFMFIFIGMLLHKTPKNFLMTIADGARTSGGILIQFPFYAAIMGMMQDSGLVNLMVDVFHRVATVETLPFLTFISAGVINLFIPSGGAQWVIQGPITLDAANRLGADVSEVSMAIAWGDAWTNLIHPLWAALLLSIAGVRLRDIAGYTTVLLFVSGAVISLFFL